MAAKGKSTRLPHKPLIFGDEEGFHITVRGEAFSGDDGYEVTIWKRNHGTSGLPTIYDKDKAQEIASYLYDKLLPEYEEQQRRQEEWSKKFTEELARRPKPKPPKVLKNAPKIKVLVCPDCTALIPPDDVSDERVYECQNCGTSGAGEDGRRCEQCNKFTAKVSDTSCPECSAAMDDAEEAEAQRATDGTLVKVEKPST